MKALVILLTVAIMIGGIVTGVAASKPADSPPNLVELGDKLDTLIGKVDVVGTDVSTIESEIADIRAELASVPRMASCQDLVWVDSDGVLWDSEDLETLPYDSAHFHVTVSMTATPAGEEILVMKAWRASNGTESVTWESIASAGVHTSEFDAIRCWIVADGFVDAHFVAYAVTVTYVPQT